MFQQTKDADSVFSEQLGGNVLDIEDGYAIILGVPYLEALRDWETRNRDDLNEHDIVMAFTRYDLRRLILA